MSRQPGDFFDNLFKTINTLATVAGLICFFLWGFVAYGSIFAHLKNRKNATTVCERGYYDARLWMCYFGAYSWTATVLLFASDDFGTYWPAVSAKVMEKSAAIGGPAHSAAIVLDILLSMLLCACCFWLSELHGHVHTNYEGKDSFFAK